MLVDRTLEKFPIASLDEFPKLLLKEFLEKPLENNPEVILIGLSERILRGNI